MKNNNKYYQFKTINDTKVLIKQSRHMKENAATDGVAILKYKDKNSIDWLYYTPDIKFSSIMEIIHYICKHTESDGTKFKIVSFKG